MISLIMQLLGAINALASCTRTCSRSSSTPGRASCATRSTGRRSCRAAWVSARVRPPGAGRGVHGVRAPRRRRRLIRGPHRMPMQGNGSQDRRPDHARHVPGPDVPIRKFGRRLRDPWSCLAPGGGPARTRRTCGPADGRQTRAGARRLPPKLRIGTLGVRILVVLETESGLASLPRRRASTSRLRSRRRGTRRGRALDGRGRALRHHRARRHATGHRRLRCAGGSRTISTPVLILTARHALPIGVLTGRGGADDYLTQPFQLAELFARLRALARRAPAPPVGRARGRRSATRSRHPSGLA